MPHTYKWIPKLRLYDMYVPLYLWAKSSEISDEEITIDWLDILPFFADARKWLLYEILIELLTTGVIQSIRVYGIEGQDNAEDRENEIDPWITIKRSDVCVGNSNISTNRVNKRITPQSIGSDDVIFGVFTEREALKKQLDLYLEYWEKDRLEIPETTMIGSEIQITRMEKDLDLLSQKHGTKDFSLRLSQLLDTILGHGLNFQAYYEIQPLLCLWWFCKNGRLSILPTSEFGNNKQRDILLRVSMITEEDENKTTSYSLDIENDRISLWSRKFSLSYILGKSVKVGSEIQVLSNKKGGIFLIVALIQSGGSCGDLALLMNRIAIARDPYKKRKTKIWSAKTLEWYRYHANAFLNSEKTKLYIQKVNGVYKIISADDTK